MSSDSDISIAFRQRKQASKVKKENNQKSSTKILESKKVKFKSCNWGSHLIVTGKDGIIDFWPSTGKFIHRSTGKHGRGIRRLLRLC